MFSSRDTKGSRWMIATFVNADGTTTKRYPTDGQGGSTTTASASALAAARKVILTGIYVLAYDTAADATLRFVDAAGADIAGLLYTIRNSAAAEKGRSRMGIEIDGGFGVRMAAAVTAGQTVQVIISYRPVL